MIDNEMFAIKYRFLFELIFIPYIEIGAVKREIIDATASVKLTIASIRQPSIGSK
jgi:hypothetical protein